MDLNHARLVLPPFQAGRALPRAHSITCFTGFNSRENKVTKRPKDKSMCARRDVIAQRCSPGLASTPAEVQTAASVTIRPPIPTPVQLVSPI